MGYEQAGLACAGRRLGMAGGAKLLAIGTPDQVIAGQPVITVDRAKRQVSHLLDKLGAANHGEAVTRAHQFGLIPSRYSRAGVPPSANEPGAVSACPGERNGVAVAAALDLDQVSYLRPISGIIRIKSAYQGQAQPEAPDLGQHAMQCRLVGEQADDDGLRAVVAELEAAEPVRPLVVEDAVDADLVRGRPP